MGGPDPPSPCLVWDWGSKSENDIWSLAELGVGKGRQEGRTLVSWLLVWSPCGLLHADEQPGVAGRMALAPCRLCWERVGWRGRLPRCLPSLPCSAPCGDSPGSIVLSPASSDAQTNCWATARLYKGQDFLEFPRLFSCQQTRPASPPPCL